MVSAVMRVKEAGGSVHSTDSGFGLKHSSADSLLYQTRAASVELTVHDSQSSALEVPSFK